MYAPVLLRLRRFGVELPAPLQAYADAIFSFAPLRDWLQLAATRP